MGHFKKGHRHLLGSIEMRFCFIHDQRATFPVRVMCKMLDVSASGYYAWRGRPESMRTAANRQLIEAIRRVHGDSRGRYGSPRVHAALRAEGRQIGRNRVARLMHHHGFVPARSGGSVGPRIAATISRWLPISSADGSRHRLRIVSGWRTSRIFRPPRVGFISRSSSTCSPVESGLGEDERITQVVTLDALRMAIATRRPRPGLLHHSDRGSRSRLMPIVVCSPATACVAR